MQLRPNAGSYANSKHPANFIQLPKIEKKTQKSAEKSQPLLELQKNESALGSPGPRHEMMGKLSRNASHHRKHVMENFDSLTD